MGTFRLTPVKLGAEEWALSALRTPVQVIAEDAIQARHAAADQLHWDTPPSNHTGGILHNPWLRTDLVTVEEVAGVDDSLPLLQGHMPNGKRGRPSAVNWYLLTPLDRGAPEWRRSICSEVVCVEARHPHHARARAALFFDAGPDQTELLQPWWNPRLVEVLPVQEPPPGVLRVRSASLSIHPSRRQE